MRKLTVALAAAVCGASLYVKANAGTAEVVVTPVGSTDTTWTGQPIVFPQKPGHVTTALFEIAPGATLPVHKHPFPRIGYVLDGSLRVTSVEGGRSETFERGQVVVESLDQWHKGENPGTTPLKLLVIDLIEKGAENTVVAH